MDTNVIRVVQPATEPHLLSARVALSQTMRSRPSRTASTSHAE